MCHNLKEERPMRGFLYRFYHAVDKGKKSTGHYRFPNTNDFAPTVWARAMDDIGGIPYRKLV